MGPPNLERPKISTISPGHRPPTMRRPGPGVCTMGLLRLAVARGARQGGISSLKEYRVWSLILLRNVALSACGC